MKIQFINGPMAGEMRELQPPGVSIGREDDNDIQLLVAGVSRYHAKISFDGLVWSITDAGSTNGTKLNQNPLKTTMQLAPGDLITLGNQIILFGPGSNPQEANAVERTAELQAPAPDIPQKKGCEEKEISLKIPSPDPAIRVSVPQETKEEEKSGTQASKDITLSGSIFGGKEENAAVQDGSPAALSAAKSGKKKLSNFLFYTLVISSVIILLGCFVFFNSAKTQDNADDTAEKKKKTEQFCLSYEHKKIDPDNIFRFSLELSENTAVFTIDDLKYQRKFRKQVKVPEKMISELKTALKESGVMNLAAAGDTSSSAPGASDSVKNLSAVLEGKIQMLQVRNTYPPTSFEKAENAISDFASNFDIRTDIMTVEDMRKEALKAFAKAEQLYRNREGNPKNLHEAIKRYQLTMDYLEQFDPKPEEWQTSRTHLAEARELLKKKISDLNFEIKQARKLKQYDRAVALCQRAMDMFDEKDQAYQQARKLKLALEDILRAEKKK